MAVSRRLLAAAAVPLAALVLAACGEDEFANDPRPAAPIELSGLINDKVVKVSPSRARKVGAGLASIVVSNQSDEPAAFVLEGPTEGATDEIQPGGTGTLRINLKQGEYVVATDAGGPRETILTVGPPRPSASNELLLP